jgi:hypothetical protein
VRVNEDFWRMVFAGGGFGFSELKEMDGAEYQEALAAFVLWHTEWNKKN